MRRLTPRYLRATATISPKSIKIVRCSLSKADKDYNRSIDKPTWQACSLMTLLTLISALTGTRGTSKISISVTLIWIVTIKRMLIRSINHKPKMNTSNKALRRATVTMSSEKIRASCISKTRQAKNRCNRRTPLIWSSEEVRSSISTRSYMSNQHTHRLHLYRWQSTCIRPLWPEIRPKRLKSSRLSSPTRSRKCKSAHSNQWWPRQVITTFRTRIGREHPFSSVL